MCQIYIYTHSIYQIQDTVPLLVPHLVSHIPSEVTLCLVQCLLSNRMPFTVSYMIPCTVLYRTIKAMLPFVVPVDIRWYQIMGSNKNRKVVCDRAVQSEPQPRFRLIQPCRTQGQSENTPGGCGGGCGGGVAMSLQWEGPGPDFPTNYAFLQNERRWGNYRTMTHQALVDEAIP